MKPILLILSNILLGVSGWFGVLCLLPYTVTGQPTGLMPSVIAVTGSSDATASYRLDATVGQLEYQTLAATNTMLTEGFQQPFTITDLESEVVMQLGISVFPNPTARTLTFERKVISETDWRLYLLDVSGHVVLHRRWADMSLSETVDCTTLSAGHYWVYIQDGTCRHWPICGIEKF